MPCHHHNPINFAINTALSTDFGFLTNDPTARYGAVHYMQILHVPATGTW